MRGETYLDCTLVPGEHAWLTAPCSKQRLSVTRDHPPKVGGGEPEAPGGGGLPPEDGGGDPFDGGGEYVGPDVGAPAHALKSFARTRLIAGEASLLCKSVMVHVSSTASCKSTADTARVAAHATDKVMITASVCHVS
jgi:hypothetical protein